MQRELIAISLRESFTLSPGGEPVADTYGSPADLINIILPNLFVFAGVILFFFIFGAGFRILMNPGDAKKLGEGQSAIMYAIGGFILLIAAYWIMQIIGVVFGVDILGG